MDQRLWTRPASVWCEVIDLVLKFGLRQKKLLSTSSMCLITMAQNNGKVLVIVNTGLLYLQCYSVVTHDTLAVRGVFVDRMAICCRGHKQTYFLCAHL